MYNAISCSKKMLENIRRVIENKTEDCLTIRWLLDARLPTLQTPNRSAERHEYP